MAETTAERALQRAKAASVIASLSHDAYLRASRARKVAVGEARAAGCSFGEIARALGITRGAVQGILR